MNGAPASDPARFVQHDWGARRAGCRRIDSLFPEDQRDYMIKTALTNYLNGSGSLGGKLDQIGALVNDDVTDADVAHLDEGLAARAAVGMAAWEWDVRTGIVTWSGEVEAVFGRDAQQLFSMEAIIAQTE